MVEQRVLFFSERAFLKFSFITLSSTSETTDLEKRFLIILIGTLPGRKPGNFTFVTKSEYIFHLIYC